MIILAAQDLLNQWVSDTIHVDAEDEDYSDERWDKKTESEIKREWDHLLSNDADLELDELVKSNAKATKTSTRSKGLHQ